MPSNNAEKCKNYRKRKKDAALKIKKTPKTSAERSRMYRLRKKQLAQGSKLSANEVLYTPSTSNSQMTFEPSSQPVTTAKARIFHAKLGGEPNFKASDEWLFHWRSKFGIRQLSILDEQNSVNESAAIKFKEEFVEFIVSSGYHPSQIFNADETGLNFKMMPTKTLILKEENTLFDIEKNEERVTVMACCNADGSMKIPLLVTGKLAKPRVIKNVASNFMPVTYTHQKSALINCHIFDEWFKTQFVPQVFAFLDEHHLPRKAILLLDSAPSHPPQETLNIDGITVMYLSPNVTSFIQPMEQGMIETLIKKYKMKLLFYMLNCQDEGISLTESLKSITIETVIDWLSSSWYEIDVYTIKKCWKQLIPSLYFTSMKDQPLQSHEYISTLLHHLHDYADISSDIIDNWIQYDSQPEPPTDEEIMEQMNRYHTEGNLENNDPEVTILKLEMDEKVNSSQALMEIGTVINYFQQSGNISAVEMNMLQQLRDRAFMAKILNATTM